MLVSRSKFLIQILLNLVKVWFWIWVPVCQSYWIECLFETSKASSAKPVESYCDLVRLYIVIGGGARASCCNQVFLLNVAAWCNFVRQHYSDSSPDLVCNIAEDLEGKEGSKSHQSWSTFQVSDVTGERLTYTAIPAAKQIDHFSIHVTNSSHPSTL